MRKIIYITSALLFSYVFAEDKSGSSYSRFELITASETSHSRSAEWKPGDGITLEVSGMAWMDDKLAVCTRKGDVWMVENPLSDDRDKIKFNRFASGLHEPLGLHRDGKDILVSQRSEITRLQDNDGDGLADAFLTECDGWNVSGNYHAYAYGPEKDGQGNLWVTLNLGMGDLANNKIGWRGWGGVIGKDGEFVPKSLGMRSPSGMGANRDGDMFYSDQQGTWIPATPIYHLRPGVFFGNQESLPSLELADAPFKMSKIPEPNQPYPDAVKSSPEFTAPAVWLPYNKMGRSATDIQVIDENGKFGPFDGQMLIGEFTNSSVNRVFLEKVNGEYQGACFPFLDGFPAAVVRLSFSPDGSLMVGMTNRGWSSLGNRSYGLERVSFTGDTPLEIQEMRAKPDGFELVFTKAIDAKTISESALSLSSYTYEYSSKYGGEEMDTKKHKVSKISVSDDGLKVQFQVDNLRELHVFELQTTGIKSADGVPLEHSNAYYTLNRIPK